MSRPLAFYCKLTTALVLIVVTIENAAEPIQVRKLMFNVENPLTLNVNEKKMISVSMVIDEDNDKKARNLPKSLWVQSHTRSPQFPILFLSETSGDSDFKGDKTIISGLMEIANDDQNSKVKRFNFQINPTYLGRATVEFALGHGSSRVDRVERLNDRLEVRVIQKEGVWGTIFLVSVSLLIIITYINLGAQLDIENIKLVVKKPKMLITGFLISTLVMPSVSWGIARWLLAGRLLFQVGALVFACGPAASASTLWTVMLDADKELSIALQAASNIGSIIVLPPLLYIIETYLLDSRFESQFQIPYARLTYALLVLVAASLLGWIIGRNERYRNLSAKIFRPLTFVVLLYIIIFSSIIYWFIYRMFDWNIMLASLIIVLLTCAISGSLSYFISDFNKSHTVAIALSSTYKNSGIAFTIFLVAFESPDTYIAYVPCLTQVVITSMLLYLTFGLVKLVERVRRRNQPKPISAEVISSSPTTRRSSIAVGTSPDDVDGTTGTRDQQADQTNDAEFIPMDLTNAELN